MRNKQKKKNNKKNKSRKAKTSKKNCNSKRRAKLWKFKNSKTKTWIFSTNSWISLSWKRNHTQKDPDLDHLQWISSKHHWYHSPRFWQQRTYLRNPVLFIFALCHQQSLPSLFHILKSLLIMSHPVLLLMRSQSDIRYILSLANVRLLVWFLEPCL